MCCTLNVFVLALDVLFKLAIVRTIAVERNDKGKKTEESEEQQETFFYGIDKLWKENAHNQITTPFGVV
jgi:hypothetical protein